jgi:outer membrane lipoprotein SlyB
MFKLNYKGDAIMSRKLVSIMLASSMFIAAGAAQAKGCIEGAAVGGVAGHVAGKHGTAGAVGGCAIGHHEASKKEKKAQEANAASAPSGK